MRPEQVSAELAGRSCPDFGAPAWCPPPVTADARQVALVSTAGLIQRGDRPFGVGASDYRIVDRDHPAELLMTHISTNFDRSGFVQDHEVAFPLRRVVSAAERGVIGRAARFHYSFMGATDPNQMRPAAEQLARTLAGEGSNVALLVPV